MSVEHWIERADARLFVVEEGSGTPIVLLHGGLANHLTSVRLAGTLPLRFRLVTPDLRASGRSHFAGELTWESLADDLEATLDALSIERAVVGGISFGAACALAFALRHPSRLRALVLLTPAHAGDALGFVPAQVEAMRAMQEAGERALVEGHAAFEPLLATLPLELRERARATFAIYDLPSVAALTRFLERGPQPFDRMETLAAVDVPALVVPGADETHPKRVAELYAACLRRCTSIETTDFARAIERFVDGLP